MDKNNSAVFLTKHQMRQLDKNATVKGVDAVTLMENAGKAVAEESELLFGKGSVSIFCGYGNNGGDGLVAARYLIQSGCDVTVYFAGMPKSLSPETNTNLEALFTIGAKPAVFLNTEKDIEGLHERIRGSSFIIDAIFGIGLRGELDNFYRKLINRLNDAAIPIVAVDIPSGLDADTGKPLGNAITARFTITLGFPKVGFKNPAAKKYLGDIIVADIGLPKTEAADLGSGTLYEGAVRLRKGKHGHISPGHPWIYRRQIASADNGVRNGDIVRILSSEGTFKGIGYYNKLSNITTRILSFEESAIDKNFFAKRIEVALAKREELKAGTNAYRAVFSEADALPGLIVDVYNDTACFQILTCGMENFKDTIVECIRDIIPVKFIYEKSVSPFRKIEGLEDVAAWHGPKGEPLIEISEFGARFLVDIVNGHKTGFYLDQRKSRLDIRPLCKGKDVLDLFCYTGGFSVNAVLGGAKSVKGVDIKNDWLELARKNIGLNSAVGKAEFIQENAFDFLRAAHSSGKLFDVIIIDPPSFLRKRESLESASKGYKDLNLMAMKTIRSGGMLCTFSCSHNMPNELFSDILKRSARDARKQLSIVKRCHQDKDHPIVRDIPETDYLKGYFLKIDDIKG